MGGTDAPRGRSLGLVADDHFVQRDKAGEMAGEMAGEIQRRPLHQLRDAAGERMFHFRSLDRAMRFLVGASVAQLVAIAVLEALRTVHSPTVAVLAYRPSAGATPIVLGSSVVVYWLVLVVTTVAWALVVTGALYAHWVVRVLALGGFCFWWWEYHRDASGNLAASCVLWGLLAGVIGVGVGSLVRDRRGSHAAASAVGRLALLALLAATVGGVEFVGWWGSHAAVGSRYYTTGFGSKLEDFSLVLFLLLLVAGADLADWVLLAVDGIVSFPVKGGENRAASLAFAACVMMLLGLLVTDSWLGLAWDLAFGGMLAAALAAVLVWERRCKGRGHQIPYGALVAAAVVDVAVILVVGDGGSVNDTARRAGILACVWMAVAAATAILLVMRGRQVSVAARAVIIFVFVAAVIDVLVGFQGVVYELGGSARGDVFLSYDGVKVACALVAIGLLVYAFARKRPGLAALFTLLARAAIAVQVVEWLSELYAHLDDAGDRLALVAGVALIAGLAVELLFSGDVITNGDSRAFPRHARVLMFLGYILMVAATVLLFSSLHQPGHAGLSTGVGFPSEQFVSAGLIRLGIPLVLTVTILRLADWAGSRDRRAVPVGTQVRVAESDPQQAPSAGDASDASPSRT